MSGAITPAQFAERLTRFQATIPAIVADGIFTATNTLYGHIIYRIFNEGNAADGSTIGQYSTGYKRRRNKRGRQTAYKDFEIDGTLRRAIQIGRDADGKCTIGILPVGHYGKYNAADVSGFLETQIGGRLVFAASQDEITNAKKEAMDYINKILWNK